MAERTEDQKVFQEPIEVMLGGKKWAIKPLVIKYSRPWRKKVVDLIAELPKYTEVDTSKPDDFAKSLKMLMVESQDMVIDLFFEYAKDLDRNEIEGTATEKEISDAFEAVMTLAFPLSQTLPAVMGPPKKKPQRQRG